MAQRPCYDVTIAHEAAIAPLGSPQHAGNIAPHRRFFSNNNCTHTPSIPQTTPPRKPGRGGSAACQWPAVPAARAFGSDSTQTRPTSRGRVCCGAFLAARWWAGRRRPAHEQGGRTPAVVGEDTALRSPQKPPQAASPCSLTCRRLHAPVAPIRNETKRPSPLLVGLGRVAPAIRISIRPALMRSLCIFFRLELTFGSVLLIIIHYKMMLCG